MADGGVPIERLRQYLRELSPEARAMLATEVERALARGDAMPGASLILDELRNEASREGRQLPPRFGNAQRLFFAPFEAFLVDDVPERKHCGRISRSTLDPLWNWICRDLMPGDAKIYADQVTLLLNANEKSGAEQVARAFQDRVEVKLREILAAVKGDDKSQRRLIGQIGTPQASEDVREFQAILRVRDALGVIASRLPLTIHNLADDHLENVKALLDSPIARHRDVFLYSMIVVMGRLSAPWQLIRLAIKAAESDSASRIAATPFSVAVEIVLTDIERMIAALRTALKSGHGENLAMQLKDIHDAVRGIRSELDLSGDSAWARQLSAYRGDVAKLLQAEIESVPGRVRRLLRPRNGKDVGVDSTLDPLDVTETEALLDLALVCRNYAGELAISEATRRVYSDVQNFFDTGPQILIDRLKTSPPAERRFRQSQLDAAIRFCNRLFGAEYAATLSKAADVAAKGEAKAQPKVAKA